MTEGENFIKYEVLFGKDFAKDLRKFSDGFLREAGAVYVKLHRLVKEALEEVDNPKGGVTKADLINALYKEFREYWGDDALGKYLIRALVTGDGIF